MENPKRIANCFIYNINGNNEFFPASDVIRGINTNEPIFLPFGITASIVSLCNFFFNLVPLQNPPL